MQNSSVKLNIKPFNFQLLQSEKLNEILLENLDIDQVIVNNDISSCAAVLRNLVQADISADTIRSLSYEQFKKILTISQTCIDFYTQNQEFQDQQINDQLTELRQKQEQLEKLRSLQQKHQAKESSLNAELDKLKKDAITLKEKSIKNIVFKCHLCDKCFQTKDYLFSHIERAHDESKLEDVANPEYMAQMLKQIQTFKAQSEQQLTFGQFTQSKGFANSQQQMATGSLGFQEMKQQQMDKIEEKRKRKEEREIKREKDRMERLERLRTQEYQMQQFQQSVTKQLDQKYNHMLKLQSKQIEQVQQQSEEVRNALFNIQQEIHLVPKQIDKDESAIQPVEQDKSKGDDQLREFIDQDLSQNSLNSHNRSADQKLLITKNQQIADQSGLPSFHNYSINDKSQILIKQNNEDAQKNKMMEREKLQSDMDHIGELESDNEIIEDEQGRDFIRPQNQQKQLKTATDELIKAIYNKDQNKDTNLDEEAFESKHSETHDIMNKERSKLVGDISGKEDIGDLEERLNQSRKARQPK